MKKGWLRLWRALRRLSGDDAYERYLAHWHEEHADTGKAPLSRSEFFRAEQERKWSGIKRCC
ncbi:CstA-like transporter-associated (seleno)protein [Methyloterricola oryzae]|uniref:CstA-like transporter-associated (seleno)protein n=1 Tax=Methyloterricola oryzae TaxID=1495050 RepID=UPI0005EB4F1E|nr:YbdD/YjiX family protein [Methyloterricola oryzae]